MCDDRRPTGSPTVRTPATTGRRSASEAKPAILTVDDDPGVSRAVARDLRRRYGKDHRIVRAESGMQALDALHEMKLRGDHGRRAARRPPDAADGRHPVPGKGDGHLPHRAPGAAHRLRRHRRRDHRDQRRRPGLLPAQAVGPAGGEVLPGHRPAAGLLAAQPITARRAADQADRAPLVREIQRGQGLPGPQPGAVRVLPVRRAGGRTAARPQRVSTTPGCPW